MPVEDREKVRWAALLHDIGKLRVPGEILRKPGKPTADEWTLLKTHPAEGLELIRGPLADWLGDWARAIGEHHEQFDGSGYPAGLSGTDISYAGRLVAVADVFDVITATRFVQEGDDHSGSQAGDHAVRRFAVRSRHGSGISADLDRRPAQGNGSALVDRSTLDLRALGCSPRGLDDGGHHDRRHGTRIGPRHERLLRAGRTTDRVAHTAVVLDPTNTLENGGPAASDGSTNSPGGGEADPIASPVLPADHAGDTGTSAVDPPLPGTDAPTTGTTTPTATGTVPSWNHAAGHDATAQRVDPPGANGQHPTISIRGHVPTRSADQHPSHHHPGHHRSADHDSDSHDSDFDSADQCPADHGAAPRPPCRRSPCRPSPCHGSPACNPLFDKPLTGESSGEPIPFRR